MFGKVRTASESTLRLVASVYEELQNMLVAAAPDQILARGQVWSSIVSGDASKGLTFGKKSTGSIVSLWHHDCDASKASLWAALKPCQHRVKRAHINPEMRMVVPSAERSAERSMTLYGQMSNKGWSRHDCSPFPSCKRSVVFGGVPYLRHCFFRKSTQSPSPLCALAYGVQ